MLATSIGLGFVPVAYALLTRVIINSLVGHQSVPTILGIAGLAITTAALLILAPLTSYAVAELNRKLEVGMQGDLFAAVGQLYDLRLLESPRFLDRLRLAQQAGLSAPAQVVAGCLATVQSGVTLIGFVAALAVLDPWIAVLVVGSGIPAIVAELRLGTSRAEMYLRVSPFRRRILGYISLLVDPNAAQEVQAFGLGSLLRERLLRAIDHATRAERTQDRREVRTRTVLACIAAAASVASLSLVAVGALHGQFNVGDVAIVLAALSTLQLSLSGLVAQFGQMSGALRMLDHYRAVIASATEATSGTSRDAGKAQVGIGRLRRGVELRGVSFRYDESQPWVLQDVDLFIPFNASLALVGPNGSGKSTIVKLLCRFYDPTRGAVLWDGVDLRELPVVALRRQVSLVLQDPVMYDLNASENIGVGNVALLADRDAIRRAADLADIDDVLAHLPHGYDTLLSRLFFDDAASNVGIVLSAGQAQRLAIARALMRTDADLLIMDEPSSSLDAQAEHLLQERLSQLRGGRATLLISHRLSSVRAAAQIVVLDGGRVVEVGSHQQLLEVGGMYAELFQLQAAGYADLTLPLRSS